MSARVFVFVSGLDRPFLSNPHFMCQFELKFRHWWAHVECLVRSNMIVLSEPLVDDGSGLVDARRPFSVEDFAIMEQEHQFAPRLMRLV
jgi:hypothetical protein